MCGIFGVVGGEAPAEEVLAQVVGLLAHRGPDTHGIAVGDTFAFAHTRLRVIDLSPAAAQPMHGADGSVLVFNGEIYNFRELHAELEARGHRFRSRSDTEVILAGYAAFGDAVVERLDGMFAFGLWDPRRRRLLLARDRVGKKPLFYRIGGGATTLAFASEIKALRAAGPAAELDPAGLVGLLAYGYPTPPHTLLRGVAQLPPAHRLTFEPDSGHPPRLERYYEPQLGEGPRDERPEPVVLADVRRALEDAVARRMVADVPVGAFLSGGIDSTIVVGLMQRLTGTRVRTFSIGFAGDPRYDETHYARIAARAFGTDHTEHTVRATDLDLVDRLIWLHDGPFGDSSAVPTYLVSGLARQHVTVALTGDGGDELFAGYLRLAAGAITERVPAPLRTALAALGRRLPAGLPDRSLPARARRLLEASALPLGDRVVRWNSFFAMSLDTLLRPELRPHAAGVLAFHRDMFPAHDPRSPLWRLLAHNFHTYLPHDLLVKADRCSMGHGLELRSPLLDTALTALCARLPDRMLVRGRTLKYALRRACADLLPPDIARRGKMGFGMPLATWFRGELAQEVRSTLLAPGARINDHVEPAAVRALLDDHLASRCDQSHQIWLLLTLERWLRGSRGAA